MASVFDVVSCLGWPAAIKGNFVEIEYAILITAEQYRLLIRRNIGPATSGWFS